MGDDLQQICAALYVSIQVWSATAWPFWVFLSQWDFSETESECDTHVQVHAPSLTAMDPYKWP